MPSTRSGRADRVAVQLRYQRNLAPDQQGGAGLFILARDLSAATFTPMDKQVQISANAAIPKAHTATLK